MMYDLITATSMGVRITPELRQPAGLDNRFTMHATSAESNVLNVSASLGLKTKVLTAFVKGSPISTFIKRELGSRFIAFEGPEIEQGGPWGFRHQFNIADAGFGPRGPRVHNDRAGEVGLGLGPEYFDLDRVFVQEGARMIHFSGLFAALSPKTAEFCLALAAKARESGCLISFDLNYRASFWKGREQELREAFHRIASVSDVLIGNEEDYQLALGLKGPDAGGHDVGKTEEFKAMIMQARETYPNVSVFATTLRQVISANEHLWGAILYKDGEWFSAPPREIQVYDRIGGGDGFVSGLLYALLHGWNGDQCVQFGWATGALAATMTEDYASPADEEQVWSVWKGNARVQR